MSPVTPPRPPSAERWWRLSVALAFLALATALLAVRFGADFVIGSALLNLAAVFCGEIYRAELRRS